MDHFTRLKEALCFTPILHLPDFHQPFDIETYAFQYVIGAMLKQGRHLVAYHYDTFSQEKINYSTYDKEFYSLA